jgi:hypothetical protein
MADPWAEFGANIGLLYEPGSLLKGDRLIGRYRGRQLVLEIKGWLKPPYVVLTMPLCVAASVYVRRERSTFLGVLRHLFRFITKQVPAAEDWFWISSKPRGFSNWMRSRPAIGKTLAYVRGPFYLTVARRTLKLETYLGSLLFDQRYGVFVVDATCRIASAIEAWSLARWQRDYDAA